MKGLIYSLLLLIIFFSETQAQKIMTKRAPLINDNIGQTGVYNHKNTSGSNTRLAQYMLVDYMQNAWGPANSTINPLTYDPYSDIVAIVHRGHMDYSSGSGELWYNVSTDRGINWNRIPIPINGNFIQELARYPNMTISNPQHSPVVNNTLAAFSWPELPPPYSSFGWIGYAVDQSVGGGNYTGDIITGQYSTSVPIWSSDNSSWVFWIAESISDASLTLFRTEDFVNVEQIVFPSSIFQNIGVTCLGGVSVNGTIYIGVLGTFPPPDPGNPIISGWYPGYIQSTDYGNTWSSWQVEDFRQVPSLSDYDRLYDFKKNDNITSYCGDINVDIDGYVHFALALTDTTSDENTGINSVVDLFETASGWDAKIIYTGLIDGSFNYGPGLGEMGPSPYFAFNVERNVMACQWVNGLSESLPWCDIFFSYRTLYSNWSDPINITESDSINNTQSHLAPVLAGTGPQYTAFSMYGYQDGYTGPYPDSTMTTNIYIASLDFNIENIPVELINFSIQYSGSSVMLNWETATETNNYGFEIHRKRLAEKSWDKIGFVRGNGTSAVHHKYEYRDRGLSSGEYSYRLKQIDYDGSYTYSETNTVNVANELKFELSQNFPNPFNPSTEIQYSIPQTNHVVLKLYDILGNEVKTIVNRIQEAGLHKVNLNTNNLASGIYFYKLESGDFVKVKKMMLMK